MKKQKSLLLLFFLIFVLILVGCTNKEANSVSDEKMMEMENKIAELEEILKEQQSSQEELEKLQSKLDEIDSLNVKLEFIDESITYLMNDYYVLNRLLHHTTSYKTAMLNSAEIADESLKINITYTNKLVDEDAPNGFTLVETEEGTKELTIGKEVPIFILENPSKLVEATWDQVGSHQRFFQLFEKDGKVVFIMESYLP